MSSHIEKEALYLVTGGAGFVGSNIVWALVEGGARVRVLDDFSTGSRENLDGLMGSIELIEGSVEDEETCQEAASGADYVLHQAAIPSVPRSIKDPERTHRACATGTLNMLIAARDRGAQRFVYASSSSVYGNTPVLPKAEDATTTPMSPYAVAKLAGEAYARVFYEVFGLETVSLRYFNIFGPRQSLVSEYAAVIPKFLGHALRGTPPTVNGDGNQTRDFTYVDNAVLANLRACRADAMSVAGRVFNVGCGQRVSVNDLWRQVCEVIGTDHAPSHGAARPGDVRDSLACLERAQSALGYRVEVPLKEGLIRTAEWYRTQVLQERVEA